MLVRLLLLGFIWFKKVLDLQLLYLPKLNIPHTLSPKKDLKNQRKQSVSALETSLNFPLGFHHLVWIIQSQSIFSFSLSLSSGFSQWMQMFAPLQIGAWRRQLSIVSAKHIPIIFSLTKRKDLTEVNPICGVLWCAQNPQVVIIFASVCESVATLLAKSNGNWQGNAYRTRERESWRESKPITSNKDS